jgi:type IV secretory pathway VirB10-like protein
MSSSSLEEIVKTNLGNYEARYDANDWGRMEAMLGTTTDSNTFNWKPVLIIFIVVAVLGGGYAIFTHIDFSRPVEKAAAPAPPPVVKKTITPTVKKVVPPPVVTPPPINQDSLKKLEEDTRIAKEEEERKARLEAKKVEEARLKKERKREEPTKEELEAREARRAKRRALADSNKTKEDSSRTSVKEPKKEKQKSSGIGLNIFSTFNADSLRKYQEKLKNDSVK